MQKRRKPESSVALGPTQTLKRKIESYCFVCHWQSFLNFFMGTFLWSSQRILKSRVLFCVTKQTVTKDFFSNLSISILAPSTHLLPVGGDFIFKNLKEFSNKSKRNLLLYHTIFIFPYRSLSIYGLSSYKPIRWLVTPYLWKRNSIYFLSKNVFFRKIVAEATEA